MRQERLYTLVGLFVGGAISLTVLIAVYAYDEYVREKIETYVMFFKTSLEGIHAGSDVTYRGVKIGEVKRIEITESTSGEIKIPVYVQFFVERAFVGSQSPIRLLINKGYTAIIKKSNFLTGIASIDIREPSVPKLQEKGEFNGYPIFPTDTRMQEEPTSLDEALKAAKKAFQDMSDFIRSEKLSTAFEATKNTADSLNRLVSHLHTLIPPTFSNFNQSLKEFSALIARLDHLLPPVFTAFTHTLKQVSILTSNLDEIMPPMMVTFNQSMMDISDAANSAQNLTDYLLRYPESLLWGRK